MKLTHRFSLRRKKVSEPCYCQSPLYKMSARDIAEHTFEIILTMEGITPETGNTVQVTTHHQPLIPDWIFWRFFAQNQATNALKC